MNKTGKLAVIGDAGSIYAFKTIGAETFAADSGSEAMSRIKSLIASGDYAIVFITDSLAVGISDYLEQLKDIAYPCVIPIPSASGSNGYGAASIKKDVEKAIGADILDANE